ncbi:MAG: aldehyde ferredoxin oxidoreductase family protein [Promethearchaeati archaeon SRVP18_Atabeyarchaeia-1]
MVRNGYAGQILRVDLTSGKTFKTPLAEDMARTYIGGRGIGARIIYDEVGPGVGAFDAENRLVFMTGPLTGTVVPTSGRYEVCGKSPASDAWGDANSGGYFGPELKWAGFDGIVIQGKASKPVYLWVHDGAGELKPGDHLWGKDATETEDALRGDLGDKKIRVACCGPAGERLVRFAAVINDGHRAAGRCGLGAVMGSKKLKAIVARGTQKPPLADEDGLRRQSLEAVKAIKESPIAPALGGYGSSGGLLMLVGTGDTPIKNWSKGEFADAEKLTGGALAETYLKRRYACFNCPIACGRWVKVTEAPYACEGGGPEYETCASLGTNCMNGNLAALCKANDLCNRLGLDTISAGSVIAFAMECYEKGLLTRKDCGGMELKWGDSDATIEMIRRIAFRKDIGDTLAEGVRRAAKKIGKGSEDFAVQVKGLELAMHDPRYNKSLAVTYAVGSTGGRHTEGQSQEMGQSPVPDIPILSESVESTSEERKAALSVAAIDFNMIVDAIGMCTYAVSTGFSVGQLTSLLNATTGWGITAGELMKAGERIANLTRSFNIRHGLTAKDDVLPKRLMEPQSEGGNQGQSIQKFPSLIKEYYSLRKWDAATGKPTKQKLLELGLKKEAKDLWG